MGKARTSSTKAAAMELLKQRYEEVVDESCRPEEACAASRLYDSLDAMQEMHLLTTQVGNFVIRSSVDKAKKRSAQAESESSRKRRRLNDQDADPGQDSQSSSPASDCKRVEKLVRLFLLMQRSQEMFVREIENSILEDEEEEALQGQRHGSEGMTTEAE